MRRVYFGCTCFEIRQTRKKSISKTIIKQLHGLLDKKEIDFVAARRGDKMYIQAAYDISNPNTLKREAAPFMQIKDGYPQIIIARTYQPETNDEGIHIIDVAEKIKFGELITI